MVKMCLFKASLWQGLIWLCLVVALDLPAFCSTEIVGVRLGIHEDKTRVVIDLEQNTKFNMVDTDSHRLHKIKILKTNIPHHYMSKQKGKGYISNFYFTPSSDDTIILNIESKDPTQIHKAFTMGKSDGETHRIVIDIKPYKGPAKPAVKVKTAPPPVEEAMTKETIPLPFIKPLRRIVVIDAGHGGQDPGTISPTGVHEKEITLAVALEMKRLIDKSGKYTVVLTRSTDQHLPLRYRFSVARELNAHLLISLHADSNPNKNVKGVSVYTLSETASDKEAQRLADKENSADYLEDLKFTQPVEKDVKDILINLSQTRSKNFSIEFADKLMKQFQTKEVLLKNTHRSADFAVLKAPDVASVLIELGYLSNPSDQKRLVSSQYQRKIASLIVAAIDDYFENIKS
jgi:N-acetylmuramoyl-L-alanine amidase